MKKALLTIITAMSLSISGMAEVKVTVTPLGEKPTTSQQQRKVSTAEVLVNEDFSGFEKGTVDEPFLDQSLTTYQAQEIDPDLTHGNQWNGWKCYSAGGSCCLHTLNPQDPAYISTPKMDFSGSLHISFLAKSKVVSWDDEEGDTWQYTGSELTITFTNDGNNAFSTNENQDKLDSGTYANILADIRLYFDQGWYKVDIEVDNYSAYNDAAIEFYTTDGILLDDIVVTSSMDNFIASPVVTDITNVKEDSFTVKFQPVRGSFNYYTYLYELKGYDEDGEPILQLLLAPEVMEALELYGMSLEDYIEGMGGVNSPYVNYGTVENDEPLEFTFKGLDPAKDYYYAICSHHVRLFSDRTPVHANVIAVPEVAYPTDINADSFTANWSKVTKAENYEVTLYGVNQVQEDTDDFIIFEENFDNVSAYTSATDIYNPDAIDKSSGLTMDDLTSTPGWSTNINHVLLVEGKLGLDDWSYILKSPKIYVAGAPEVSISLCVESTDEDFPLYINFAGVRYQIPVNGTRFEGTVTVPTNGLTETNFQIAVEDAPMFIDYIIMSQALKKDDYTFTYLGQQTTTDGANSCSFTELAGDDFEQYGYSVTAFRGKVKSEASDRMLVNLKSGTGSLGIEDVETEVTEIGRYSIDGRFLSQPEKGINIVRYSDGSVRKVMVK